PPSGAASCADNWGTSRAIPTSASTAWIPRPPASVAGPDPLRPLTAASPLPGDTHSTVPPSAVTRAPKSAGTAPENDTMCRPVPAPLVAAVLTVIAESRGAGRAAGAKGMRESLRQALAANAPRTANREAERTSDTGCLARKGGTGDAGRVGGPPSTARPPPARDTRRGTQRDQPRPPSPVPGPPHPRRTGSGPRRRGNVARRRSPCARRDRRSPAVRRYRRVGT